MKSPILVILFNRADLTEELFSIIDRHANHRNIYIAIDGPRNSNELDAKLCSQVVKIASDFAQKHGKNCQLLIQPKNLGCGLGVKSAIDWFFKYEERGIILEDDCHPCDEFFRILDDMLERFRANESIFMVSGTSFLPSGLSYSCDFFLSKYSQIWGWGTWRRVWKNYQFLFDNNQKNDFRHIIEQSCSDFPERFYWLQQLDRLCANFPPFTWDYQLQFMAWKNSQKSLIPSNNLVLNHGHRNDSSNTNNTNIKIANFTFPNLFSQELRCNLSYEPEIDRVIFWFSILLGDLNRFRELINNADLFYNINTISYLKHENEYLKSEKFWMEKSLSWKLTSPLRKILSYILKR
jgi:hypothetical protein